MRQTEFETCNILLLQSDSKKNKNLRFTLIRYNHVMYRLVCCDKDNQPIWHRLYRGIDKAKKAFNGFVENWEGF